MYKGQKKGNENVQRPEKIVVGVATNEQRIKKKSFLFREEEW
jgi:hypothetical protein